MKTAGILHLPLRERWYKMIESGVKTEEYREITKYWHKRIAWCYKWCSGMYLKKFNEDDFLTNGFCASCKNLEHFEKIREGCKVARFRYGYTKQCMDYEITHIRVGYGKPEWGAPKDRLVFIIELGERIQI